MSKHVWAKEWDRQADAPEAERLLNGLAHKNLLDVKIFDYPNTTAIKAYTNEKTILYMPVHSVFMGESLGISPDASATETAAGLRQAFAALVWESHKTGRGEIWFGCKDEQTIKFAEHNGCERVEYPMFRMRLK